MEVSILKSSITNRFIKLSLINKERNQCKDIKLLENTKPRINFSGLALGLNGWFSKFHHRLLLLVVPRWYKWKAAKSRPKIKQIIYKKNIILVFPQGVEP